MKLRDYQEEAIQAIYDYFAENDGNPLILAPTGSGKSVIIGAFVHGVITQWPGQRILMITHVRELVAQNYAKLKELWPDAPAGIYSASLGRRDTSSRIIYASIQSIYKKAFQLGRFDLVLIDECHLIPDSGEGMYNTFLEDMRKINPKIKVIGFTATPWRMKSGHLIGDETLFTDVAYDKCDIKFLVENGYLCPVVPRPTDTFIDASGVSIRGGEFVQKDLQRLVDVDDLTRAAVQEMGNHGGDRRSWLVFCSGVQHAENVRDALRLAGITAETVTGTTPAQERAMIIHKYKAGQIRALTNADVLTTGFDAPATDLLAILRPTQSPGLWVQIIGRGMRTAPGKTDCMVLDFAGNTDRHGPVDQIRMGRKKKSNPGEDSFVAPTKQCPQCKRLNHVLVAQCECGHLFPPVDRSSSHGAEASDASLLSFTGSAQEREINNLVFRRHKKHGKPDSLKVTYRMNMFEIAHEWVCLEHSGPPRLKAVRWWSHWIGGAAPRTVDAALEQLCKVIQLPEQTVIRIQQNGRYTEVADWGGKEAC